MPKTPKLTPAQASYVVERLIAELKLTTADINQYLQGLQTEIQHLEQRIEALRSHAPAVAPKAAPTTAAAAAPKAPRTASKKRGGGKKGHPRGIAGSFAVLLRSLPAKAQTEYQKMREERGLKEALAQLRKAHT